MTQDPTGPHANGSPNGRLDGWKEIASHLGRGMRTAQRWEQELGMPVRRLNTGGAEVVYAFKEELDAWMLGQSRTGSDRPVPGESVDEVAPARRRARSWQAAGGLVILLAAIGGWVLLRAPRLASSASAVVEGEPAALEIVGSTLNVEDAGHGLLWSRPFDVPFEDLAPATPEGAEHLKRFTAIGDFRQTGHKDVILARNTPRDPRLYYFDHAGHLKFTHRIERDVTFGSHRCTAVRFSRLFADIDGGDPGVFWIAGHELAGSFPAVLQQIDAFGRVRSEYWSAGFVGALALVMVNGRRLTLVGSAANETGGAALAVFDGAAAGSSPAADPAYRCSGCPAGAPLHYLVFPRSRLQAELGHNSQVVEISSAPGGMIRIRVVQAGNPGIPGDIGSAYYTLDSAFRIVDGDLSSDVEPIQRKSEIEHLVTPATRPRGKADLYPVLRWNGRGYDRIAGPETR